jgi:hypothetical protein
MSLFCAGWTAGSLKYLGEAGAKGITFFETAGERGIIQGDFNSRWPEQFRTVKGMIFPVYHLFKWLLKDKSCRLTHSVSSKPLEVDCLALSNNSRIKLIAANFTSTKQKLLVHGLPGECRIKMLNAESYAEAAFDLSWIEKDWQNLSRAEEHVVLEPYCLTFIEGFSGGMRV